MQAPPYLAIALLLWPATQNILNESTRPADGTARAFTNSPQENNPDHLAVFEVYGTTASAGPCSLVHHNFPWTAFVSNHHIARDGSYGAERESVLKWKPGKRDWGSIWLDGSLEDYWGSARGHGPFDVTRTLADGQIKFFIPRATLYVEEEEIDGECGGAHDPPGFRDVHRRKRAEVLELAAHNVFYNMIGGKKRPVHGYKKTCALNGYYPSRLIRIDQD